MSVDKKSSYYDAGGIEVMEVIRAKLSPEQFRGFLHGNILKYSSRMNFKGSYDRDLEKVGVYQGLLSELPSPVKSIVVPEGVFGEDSCPQCFAEETLWNHPRTMYDCGSHDADGQDFRQSERCKIDSQGRAKLSQEERVNCSWLEEGLRQREEKEHSEHLAKECAKLGRENIQLVLSNQRLTCEVSDQAVTISDLKHTIDLQMERISGWLRDE